MDIPIYLRKSETEMVKLHCIAELIQETTNHVTFHALEYLSVDLHSHYYCKRKGVRGTLELWLIEFVAATEMKPPYTYISTLTEKYRDVPEDWVDDSPSQNA
jgi:hypothetical protein